MDFVTPVFVFILVWWVVIFAVLPYGNHPEANPTIGHASGAPANPRLKQKLIVTTVISVVITAAFMVWLDYSDFTIRDMVKTWSIEQ